MRPNPDFALTDAESVRGLIRANPWATIVSSVPGRGLVASHYPILLDEEEEDLVLVSHVGRPDEQLHELGSHEAMVVVYGPQGYVSPGWYGTSPAVPTWDFAVAHLYGVPEILGDVENLRVLERLVHHFESVLPDPYLMNRTLENADYAARIVHGTVGFRMRVTRFEAKEKMSQDKPAEVIRSIVEALRSQGPYQNPRLADRIAEVNAESLGEAGVGTSVPGTSV